MAEGGPPHPPMGAEYPVCPRKRWGLDSLEYVFTSDLIHFVISRKDRSWRYSKQLRHCSPITPFNSTVQDVVDKILRREAIYLNGLFCQLTTQYENLSHCRFNICAALIKLAYFGSSFESCAKLLKYLCIIAHFSLWCLQRNLEMAPYFAVDIILGYMRDFLVEKNFTNMDDFWYYLECEAKDALAIGDITLLSDEMLENAKKLQKQSEEAEAATFTEKDVVPKPPSPVPAEVGKSAVTEVASESSSLVTSVGGKTSPVLEVASKTSSPVASEGGKTSPLPEVASKTSSPVASEGGKTSPLPEVASKTSSPVASEGGKTSPLPEVASKTSSPVASEGGKTSPLPEVASKTSSPVASECGKTSLPEVASKTSSSVSKIVSKSSSLAAEGGKTSDEPSKTVKPETEESSKETAASEHDQSMESKKDNSSEKTAKHKQHSLRRWKR